MQKGAYAICTHVHSTGCNYVYMYIPVLRTCTCMHIMSKEAWRTMTSYKPTVMGKRFVLVKCDDGRRWLLCVEHWMVLSCVKSRAVFVYFWHASFAVFTLDIKSDTSSTCVHHVDLSFVVLFLPQCCYSTSLTLFHDCNTRGKSSTLYILFSVFNQ